MLLKEWISCSSSQSRCPMKSVTTLTGASRMRRWRRFLRQRKLYKMAPGAEPQWCDVHVLCANSRTRMRQCALAPLTLAGNVLFFSMRLADRQTIFAVRDHKTNKAKDDAPAEDRYIDWRAECWTYQRQSGPYRICYLESKVHALVVFGTLLLWLWALICSLKLRVGRSVHLLP